jgi:hypothetical protein
MPERTSITQVVQLGVETTEGTPIAASKLLGAISIMPSLQVETSDFKAQGYKYRNLVVPGKEWVEAKLEGIGNFDELVYFLASLVGTPAITTVNTTGKQHVFTPSSTAEDTIKSFTIEQGSGARAHSFSGAVVSELGMEFTRDSIDVSGSMIGKAFLDGITMTASPTAIATQPMLPATVNIYLDSTAAGLGTTKLTRALQAGWNISDRYGPLWTLNSAISGYAARIETEPTAEGHLMVEADSTGMGLLTQLRAGSSRFLRIEVLDTALVGAGPATYSAQFDFAIKFNAWSEFNDEDGLWAVDVPWTVVHDPTWGKAFSFKVVGSIAAIS